MRVNLRYIGIGAFLASVALASCSGGGTATGVSSNPTGVIPTITPTGPTPTPTPTGPTPTPSPTPSSVPTPTPTVSGAVADIDFTGNFQYGQFDIMLYTNSVAIVTQSTGQTNEFVPPTITHNFFRTLGQNLPVNDIKTGSCNKPTAPPTDETEITYQDITSPDISCPGDFAKTKMLYSSVQQVEGALDLLTNLRLRRNRL